MENKEYREMPNLKIPKNIELDEEAKKKLKEIKKKLNKFQKEVLKKFDKYIIGIALLPPKKALPPELREELEDEENKELKDDEINVLVLVDDSDSKTMPKEELKEKLTGIINKIAKEVDEKLSVDTIILSELWQSCYDGKYELLQLIAMSAPIYDKGMLAAIKIAEVHKTMVLKKFERYIVSYVLAGSLVQGRATKTSDIDVWVVVDDTDVKRMSRAELKDKLRAIIVGMGIEAGELTGIRNKLNIQVYILTDFWDSLKEANPVIFTLLRDGVPFYDRGIFMPWKQLLKMGKIKPSAEAIDMFMASGAEMLNRVKFKIKDLGMEDIFYAILTPSQAALMMFGIPPPAPKETASLMRDIFVKKEKIFEEKYVKILEKVIKIRKDIEHGIKKDLTGKELDELIKQGEDYLKRIKKLFSQIEKIREEQDIINIYDHTLTLIREILKGENIDRIKEEDAVKLFKEKLIETGKIPNRYLRILEDVIKAKKDYDNKKLTKQEVENVKKTSGELIKFLVEYIQRKKLREIEEAKIRVKYKEGEGEVIFLKNLVFIIKEKDNKKEVEKAKLKGDGSIGKIESSSLDELEDVLEKTKVFEKVALTEKTFENLKKIFGSEIEVIIK